MGVLNVGDWTGHVTIMDDRRDNFKNFLEKPEDKRLQGRPRRRWKDNTYDGSYRNIDWEDDGSS